MKRIITRIDFRSHEHLSEALHNSAREEANLRGVAIAEVISEREKWLADGCTTRSFLSKWRQLNSLNIAAFCRLTGQQMRYVRKIAEWDDTYCIIEPITHKIKLPLTVALRLGYSFAEVDRARKGEEVQFIKDLVAPWISYDSDNVRH